MGSMTCRVPFEYTLVVFNGFYVYADNKEEPTILTNVAVLRRSLLLLCGPWSRH